MVHRNRVYFFFTDASTPEISTLSLHDALPILSWLTCFLHALFRAAKTRPVFPSNSFRVIVKPAPRRRSITPSDRKSTRLNSSHSQISYAVFCLKKKSNSRHQTPANVKRSVKDE